jgi:hypothetical protein
MCSTRPFLVFAHECNCGVVGIKWSTAEFVRPFRKEHAWKLSFSETHNNEAEVGRGAKCLYSSQKYSNARLPGYSIRPSENSIVSYMVITTTGFRVPVDPQEQRHADWIERSNVLSLCRTAGLHGRFAVSRASFFASVQRRPSWRMLPRPQASRAHAVCSLLIHLC